MKMMMMPKALSWWIWTVLAALQFLGLAGYEMAFIGAIVLAVLQAAYYYNRFRSWAHYAVQVRAAYAVLMMVSVPPFMQWLYWLPAIGTSALVTIGYCLMARTLSVMPWNCSEALSPDLLRRAFLTPPVAGRIHEPITDSGCPGGVCVLEARATEVYRPQTH